MTFEDFAPFKGKLDFIALCTGAPHGRTLALIEHSELQSSRVGNQAGIPPKCVYLLDYLTFSYASDRRITTHPSVSAHIHSYQKDGTAKVGGGHCGLATGVSASNNYNIVYALHSLFLGKPAKSRALGKIVILFRPHRPLFRICVIVITDKMEKTMDYYTVQLFGKLSSVENGVIADRVDADEKISGKNIPFAIIEGYDVGEVIMLQILHIDIKNIIIGTEDNIHIPYFSDFTFSHKLEPTLGFQFGFKAKISVLAKVSDHFSTVFAYKINCKRRQLQKNWNSN